MAIRPKVFRPTLSNLLSRPYTTTPRPYTFHIGASWAGKPPEARPRTSHPPFTRDFPPNSDILKWKRKMLTWPQQATNSDAGEDFFFVQQMREGSGISFGVADGVGGWVESGFDPSLFSQALMYHAHRYSKNAWAGEPETDPIRDEREYGPVEGWELLPMECLDMAHGGVLRERTVEAGSSTACVLTLNASSGLLRAANLGDSGFSVIRSSNVIHTQQPQTHYFNCPKQLAKMPANSKKFRNACVDFPQDADTFEIKLRDGDIVLTYTDGLSDNVFQTELAQICTLVRRQGGPEGEQAQAMADRIVQFARQCMANKKRVSPFEKAAVREGMYFRGGKPDDVTVVLVMVQETI